MDSKAAQMRVRSPEAGVPVAAPREVPMAEVAVVVPAVQAEVEVPEAQVGGGASGQWLSSGDRLHFTKAQEGI